MSHGGGYPQGLRYVVVTLCLCLTMAVHADEPATGDKPRPQIDPQHPLAPVLDHAYKAREALKEIKDYEALFYKRERLNRQIKATTANLKFRADPFSVYLLFQDPNKGREVIFVEGKNGGKLLAHETGFAALVGTVSLVPSAPDAMAGNRYPVTMIGLHKLLDQVIEQWEQETKFGEIDVLFRPISKLDGLECKVLETKHPQPRKQFKFHLTRLWIQSESGLPVRVEQYDFPGQNDKTPPLAEEYTYTKIRANLGLTERDFDVTNPNYAFSK